MATLLIAWRFFRLGLSPFIRDEPILQIILSHDLGVGHLPLLGLMGSYGLRYGPTAMWFYAPIRLLTGSATAIMAWHAGTFVAAFAFFFVSLRRTIGLRAAAWGTLLAASSPLLFFYSRIAWDNTFFALLSALLLHELIRLHANPKRERWLVIGLLSGLALNLHPMGVPLVAAVLVSAGPAARQARARCYAFALLPICALLALWAIGLKYFWIKWPGSEELNVHLPGGNVFTSFMRAIPGLMHFFTPASVQPFFEGTSFATSLPFPLSAYFSNPGMALSSLLGWACVVFLLLRRPYSLVTRFAFFQLLATALFLVIMRPDPMPPHYFTPCWWIGFYVLSASMAAVPHRGRSALEGLALVLVLANTFFLHSMLGFVERNEGTRNLRYGTVLRETERVTGELCKAMAEPSAVLHLENVPGVTTPPFAFFNTQLAECAGRTIFFWPNVSPVLSALHYELRYGGASSDDSSLMLRKIPAPK
jgi:hypothetical protein